MADFFFYGTLRHAPLLAQVLGELPQLQPARLPGHEVRMAMEGAAALSFPVLCRGGAGAEGVLARGLSQQQVARLQYYEAGFVFSAQPVVVQSADGPQQALVFQTEPGRWQAGPLWQLQPWVRQWGEIVTAAAEDFMAMQGVISPGARRGGCAARCCLCALLLGGGLQPVASPV
jgi:ADP-ribose pyrophosphatase